MKSSHSRYAIAALALPTREFRVVLFPMAYTEYASGLEGLGCSRPRHPRRRRVRVLY